MIDTRFQPAQIGEVLESIQSRGITLQMSLESAQADDVSLLLALDPAAKTLVLDAPRGMDDNRYLPGQNVTVSVWKNGIQLRFQLEVRRQGSFQNRPALLTNWPSFIEYIQRRNAFRIKLRNIRNRIDFILENNTHVPGRLLDISVTGFSVLVEDGIQVEPGQQANCEIEIERKSQFFALSEIRNVNRAGINDHLRVGARFVDIKTEHKLRLEKLIREFEREQLRSGRGNRGGKS